MYVETGQGNKRVRFTKVICRLSVFFGRRSQQLQS